MSPLSPSSHPKSHSPRAHPADPNINPFSALSPDLAAPQLASIDDLDPAIAGQGPPDNTLITYSKRELLLIGKQCRKRGPPEGMGPLESWFGSIARPNQGNNFEDPAIASIHPSGRRNNHNNHGGGFGEGFGFGGGIGGGNRLAGNNSRGTRNIGLRRVEGMDVPPHLAPSVGSISEKAFTGQMGKFNVKSGNTLRLGGEEQPKRRTNNPTNNGTEDWRTRQQQHRDNGYQSRERDGEAPYQQRGDHNQHNRRPNHHNPQYRDEDEQPEWMKDAAPADPAIVGSEDPLVKYNPGEDMIAAHKRAMKSRNAGDWRGGMPSLPAFFGSADPAIASSALPTLGAIDSKPKEMNANNYLVQSREEVEEESAPSQAAPEQFTSRFHRFFAAAGESPNGSSAVGPNLGIQSQPHSSQSPSQSSQADTPVDQRKAALMGMLSTKAPTPKLDTAPVRSDPSRQQSFRSAHSPSHDLPSSMSPSNMFPPGFRPPPPSALLQQIYGNSAPQSPHHDPSTTDPLILLKQAQSQPQAQYQPQPQGHHQPQLQGLHQPQMPQHMSLPPFAHPPTGMYSPVEAMRPPDFPPFMRPQGFPQGPPPPGPPGYMQLPPGGPGGGYYQQGPPRLPPGMGMGYGQLPQQGMPPQGQGMQQRYPPGQLNSSQQDMLSTLFAGLGPGSG